MGVGRVPTKGSLPVYSADTEEEAKRIVVLTCGTTADGEYFARELAEEQTLENLGAFSDRLHEAAGRLGLAVETA